VWNANSLKQQFYILFIVLLALSPVTANCRELVGVLPISNQRAQKQFEWLEYYIQARIESNLRNNSNWQFHGNEVLHLWKSRSEPTKLVSVNSTVLIQGTFQLVLNFGHFELQVNRFSQATSKEKKFERIFVKEEFDLALDALSEDIGKWISPNFKLLNKIADQSFQMKGLKVIYEYRAHLYDRAKSPGIQETLFLKESITSNSHPAWIADLAKGMIILSQFMAGKDKAFLLDHSDIILRNAIKTNNVNARLYSLLAETYYLKNQLPTWIEKTAYKAIELDPQNDLAYLLIYLVKKPNSKLPFDPISRLRSTNPWLWEDIKQDSHQFQKGILKDELNKLTEGQ
jgi:hypothetical protein